MNGLPRGRHDRWATALVSAAAFAIVAPFAWIVGDVVASGLGRISWAFLVTPPSDAGRAGGIGPVLVSTALVVGLGVGLALPLGVAAAAFLAERSAGGRGIRRAIGASLDLLAAVPSIVFGLFGMALFCGALGLGFSILSGALTLACMVLPVVVATSFAGLAAVPEETRLGAAALGLGRTATLRHLLLPYAAPSIVAGLLLAIGRASAETAALVFTSGYVTRMPTSLLDSGRTLSVHVYDLALNVPGGEPSAFATAIVLLGLLAAIGFAASALADRWRHARVLG